MKKLARHKFNDISYALRHKFSGTIMPQDKRNYDQNTSYAPRQKKLCQRHKLYPKA